MTQPVNPVSRFLKDARRVIRKRRCGIRTETSYRHCRLEYGRFHRNRHPARLGAAEVRSDPSHQGK